MTRQIIALLLLSLCLIGCERAKDSKSPPPSFELVTPSANSQVTKIDLDSNLLIRFRGKVETNNLQVNINGTDVTPSLTISSARAVGRMRDFEAFFQTGQNEIRVFNPDTGQEEVFTFFLDNVPPRVKITSLMPATPVPGSNVQVNGDIVDISPASSLVFSTQGDNYPATISGTAPNQSFVVTFPYPDRSASNWSTTAPDISYTITDSAGQKATVDLVVKEARFPDTAELFLSYSLFDSFETLLNSASKSAINNVVVKGTSLLFGNQRDKRDPNVSLISADPLYRSWPSGDDTSPGVPVGAILDFSYSAYANGRDGSNNLNTSLPLASTDERCRPRLALAIAAASAAPTPAVARAPCITRLPSQINNIPASGANASFLVPIDSVSGNGYCTAQVFDPAKVDACAIYITEVDITQPDFNFTWKNDDVSPKLRVEGQFPKVLVRITIAGLRLIPGQYMPPSADPTPAGLAFCDPENARPATAPFGCRDARPGDSYAAYVYAGSLSTTVFAENLKLNTRFSLKKGTASSPGVDPKLFELERVAGVESGFSTLLKQPVVNGTSCNICVINNVSIIELLFNIGFIKSGGKSVGELLVGEVEKSVEESVSTMLSGTVDNADEILSAALFNNLDLADIAATLQRPRPATRTINIDMASTSATTERFLFGIYATGARFKATGGVYSNTPNVPTAAPGVVPSDPAVVKPPQSLGSRFVKQGGFHDWMFHDKIFPTKEPVQLSMAISANVINQYLNSAHTTGLFDEWDFDIDTADLVDSNLNIPRPTGGNDHFLRVKTTAAPYVRLLPQQNEQSISGCFSFQGIGNCTPTLENTIIRARVDEHVELTIPSVQVFLMSSPTTSVFAVTADITLRLQNSAAGLTPLVNNFASVNVTSVANYDATPVVDAKYIHAKAGKAIRELITGAGNRKGNFLELGADIIDLDDDPNPLATGVGDDPILDSTVASLLPKTGVDAVLPMQIGVRFKVLGVDKGGDFMTMALNLVPSKVATCPTTVPAGFIKVFCLDR